FSAKLMCTVLTRFQDPYRFRIRTDSAGICLFGLSCILFALECTVLNLYKDNQMPQIYMPIAFASAFLSMVGAIVKISNSNKKRLISKKHEICIAIFTVLNATGLVCMNSFILSSEEQNDAAVYLTMEMIIAGSLVMLILPFFCTEHHQNYQPAAAAAATSQNSDRRSENIVIDDCPPKYDELFPSQF
ncbi:unnamed protein product, partial [Oikopleura dioica]